ncbi:hypothetical protein LPC08_10485 [Roseomonas sp. OT10]|uniref:hypothetical protein n=1 Tax=Roseomonas cutis TaxID=2897332 RepID=UPI001E4654E4|nr:hypothetical protein [Roseomonas sp. OT10]UFN50999.1 hypothetical protein LPC08_10485 [Roseomonas sp. OT10]
MRRAVRRLLLLLLLPAGPAAADEREIAGQMRCEAVPGISGGSSAIAFRLFAEEPVVRYERPVQMRRGGPPDAMEQGTGAWAPNGAIALRGGASGEGWSYTARYAGTLDPGGKGVLSGQQSWRYGRGRQHDRPCTIEFGATPGERR